MKEMQVLLVLLVLQEELDLREQLADKVTKVMRVSQVQQDLRVLLEERVLLVLPVQLADKVTKVMMEQQVQ
jgi:hypothetical protein